MTTCYELTASQWQKVEPLLFPAKLQKEAEKGRNNCLFVNGCLWVIRSGAMWASFAGTVWRLESAPRIAF